MSTPAAPVAIVDEFPDQWSLVGFVAGERWLLERLMHDGYPETGGNVGTGYIARDQRTGRQAFVKAVDYMYWQRDPDKLAIALNQARFESDVLSYCGERRMSKIVQMYGSGLLEFERRRDAQIYSFLYIALELGEGDIKSHVDYCLAGSVYWKLCVLRDMALAISQLEKAHLAHNDVKPSNIIRFDTARALPSVKLGDLGRVVRKDGTGPYDAELWPGDPSHRPFEIRYGVQEPEWQNRRTAADAFMLGSLMSYLFAGVSLTERVENSLPRNYRSCTYAGDYRDILDVVRHTWALVLNEQIVPTFPAPIRDEMAEIMLCLTDPDPRVRGDRKARQQQGRPVGLERFHSRFDRLAKSMGVHERLGCIK